LRQILEIAAAEPRLAEKLDAETAELRAEVVYAVREEFAVYPADFLMRRTQLRYREGNGRSLYQAVEDVMREYAPLPPSAISAARQRYMEACEWEDRLRSEQAVSK
jgi:glycerol-3-phosphate dehydrogenase